MTRVILRMVAASLIEARANCYIDCQRRSNKSVRQIYQLQNTCCYLLELIQLLYVSLLKAANTLLQIRSRTSEVSAVSEDFLSDNLGMERQGCTKLCKVEIILLKLVE